MKKMIKLAVLLAAGMALFSCSNSTQSSSTNNGNNEKKVENAYCPSYLVSFKINGKQCYYCENTNFDGIMNNEDYSGNSAAAQFLSNDKMYGSNCLGGINRKYSNTYSYGNNQISGIPFENTMYGNNKEALLTLFPSEDGKIRVTDIRINIYFYDQFYSGTEGYDNFIKKEKVIPEYYIKNNLGSNDFVLKDGTIEGFIIEGKRKENTGNYENPFEWDESVPLKKVPVSVSCKYFEPENIWKNKNNYNNLQSYIYKFKVIWKSENQQGDEIYPDKSFEIDLKKLFFLSSSIINDEDVIF